MEQLCKHRTQGIRTRKASCLSGGTGEKTGALIRNTMEIRRASKKAGVHRKKQKVLSDTRKTRSSLGKVGGIEGNTRTRWRNTRKKGRTRKVLSGIISGPPFRFLESSRTAKEAWDSFNFSQVSRMRPRKESKLWRPKETRLSTLTLLFSPSLSPLDFPYFQLFWIYPRRYRMVQAAEWISSTSEDVYWWIHSVRFFCWME